jgi:hypothetical protein
MKNKDTNRVTMIRTTSEYLAGTNSIWSVMTPFAEAVTDLNTKLAEIDAAAQRQEAPSGASADKAAARDALEDVTYLACSALGVLAHNANDNDLLALCDLSRSALDQMDEQTLSNRAANVLVAANARKTELTTLQVTQANLDEFTQALADFNETRTGPRAATAARKVETESLREKIQEATDILRNRIDRMVDLFGRTHPAFVAGYKNARVIVDRAATHSTKKPAGDNTPPPKP